jgi:hypothetical protein
MTRGNADRNVKSATLGAWGVGIALDAAGGSTNPSAWLAVFALLSVAILLGPLALIWSHTKKYQSSRGVS